MRNNINSHGMGIDGRKLSMLLETVIHSNESSLIKQIEFYLQKKEEKEEILEEKMERWVYLNDLNDRIQKEKDVKEI